MSRRGGCYAAPMRTITDRVHRAGREHHGDLRPLHPLYLKSWKPYEPASQETNGMHLVPLGSQNRTFGPYSAAIHRVLSAMLYRHWSLASPAAAAPPVGSMGRGVRRRRRIGTSMTAPGEEHGPIAGNDEPAPTGGQCFDGAKETGAAVRCAK
jgi:hypothetical protein